VTESSAAADDAILQSALQQARDTQRLLIGAGVRRHVNELFGEIFGDAPCRIITDDNTFVAAGREVYDSLRRTSRDVYEPLVFNADGLYAEYSYVAQIENALKDNVAIPIAVGAGSINDLT
jgi:glycerol-1-phosphate dehydrogenase [NAD(P)+]